MSPVPVWPVTLRPATRRRLGEPLPHQQADSREPIYNHYITLSPAPHAEIGRIQYWTQFPRLIPELKVGYSRILTRSPLIHLAS